MAGAQYRGRGLIPAFKWLMLKLEKSWLFIKGYTLLEFQITEIPLNTWSKHFIAFNAADPKNTK